VSACFPVADDPSQELELRLESGEWDTWVLSRRRLEQPAVSSARLHLEPDYRMRIFATSLREAATIAARRVDEEPVKLIGWRSCCGSWSLSVESGAGGVHVRRGAWRPSASMVVLAWPEPEPRVRVPLSGEVAALLATTLETIAQGGPV
jgi:hypothetical protein